MTRSKQPPKHFNRTPSPGNILPHQTNTVTESVARLKTNDDDKSDLSEDETVIFDGGQFKKSSAVFKTNNDEDAMILTSEVERGRTTNQTTCANENMMVDSPTVTTTNYPTGSLSTAVKNLTNASFITQDSNSTPALVTDKIFRKPGQRQARDHQSEIDYSQLCDIPEGLSDREYIAYYDINLQVPQGEDSFEEQLDVFGSFMHDIWEIDPNANLYMYRYADRNEAHPTRQPLFINGDRQFNDYIQRSNFQKYFKGAVPLMNGGMRTAKILLSHDVPFKEIYDGMAHWIQNRRAGFYLKTVQFELTKTLGWAYMSTEKTDKQPLAQALSQMMRAPIGLVWRTITLDGEQAAAIPREHRTYALHFETTELDKRMVRQGLMAIYHYSLNNGFPLGIKLRFIPDKDFAITRKDKQNLIVYRNHQRSYQKQIHHWTSIDIIDIDAVVWNNEETKSIRQILMEISTISNSKETKLFTAINKQYRKTAYWYSCLPQVRLEAEECLQTLLPRLLAMYGDAMGESTIRNMFDLSAVERADEVEWDLVEGRAKAVLSAYNEGMMGIMIGPNRDAPEFVETSPAVEYVRASDRLSVAGTISTIATTGTTTSKKKAPTKTGSTASQQSSNSGKRKASSSRSVSFESGTDATSVVSGVTRDELEIQYVHLKADWNQQHAILQTTIQRDLQLQAERNVQFQQSMQRDMQAFMTQILQAIPNPNNNQNQNQPQTNHSAAHSAEGEQRSL